MMTNEEEYEDWQMLSADSTEINVDNTLALGKERTWGLSRSLVFSY